MKPSKRIIRFVQGSLLVVGILSLIATIVAGYKGYVLGAICMAFCFIVMGLAFNRVCMEEDDMYYNGQIK